MARGPTKTETSRRLDAAIDSFMLGATGMAEALIEAQAILTRLEAMTAEAEAHQQEGGGGGTQAATGGRGGGGDGGDGALTPQHHADTSDWPRLRSRSRSRSR